MAPSRGSIRVESFTAAVVEVDVDPGKGESSRCLGTVDRGTVDLTAPRDVDDRQPLAG